MFTSTLVTTIVIITRIFCLTKDNCFTFLLIETRRALLNTTSVFSEAINNCPAIADNQPFRFTASKNSPMIGAIASAKQKMISQASKFFLSTSFRMAPFINRPKFASRYRPASPSKMQTVKSVTK
jgi:hypothetical protein